MSAKPRSAITTGGSPPRPFHRGLTVAGVVALFLLHASDGFVSDHATGDQRAYVGIAMKLERAGFGALAMTSSHGIASSLRSSR